MIEDQIRASLNAVGEPVPAAGLGPSVRSRAQRRRRGRLAVAAIAAGGLAGGGVTVAVAVADRDRSAQPSVLGALASTTASAASPECAAGPFDLVLNGQPVTAARAFTEVGGAPLGRRRGEKGSTGATQDSSWTLRRGSDNTLQVDVSGAPNAPAVISGLEVALVEDPGPSTGRIGRPAHADADASGRTASATVDLTLDSGAQAGPGDYWLDVEVFVSGCYHFGAVHTVQPVTITG